MADLKRKILDGAAALIAEQGVRGVSFREVARRAEVSHQAPYHHFGDHQGILRALAQEGFGLLEERMRARAALGETPLQRFLGTGQAYVEFALDHLGHFRAMFSAQLDCSDGPLPEGASAYACLVEFATHAAAAGHGHGLPPNALAAVCWSTGHGLATLLGEGQMQQGAPSSPPSREEMDRTSHEVMDALRRLVE